MLHLPVAYFDSTPLSATERADQEFKVIMRAVLNAGSLDINPRPHWADGTPAHTYSINNVVQTFDIQRGEFPLLSLRRIAYKSAIGEILWIYQDQTSDLDVLKDKYGISWWDDWAIPDLLTGEKTRSIGQCYGATVKKYDLMNHLLEGLKNDPDGRRHIICLWQEDDFNHSHGLKPCAMFTQFIVRHEGRTDFLDCVMMLRSSDYPTAGAINQLQYLVLHHLVARHCGYKVGKFTNYINNLQIYDRHVKNVEEMLNRESIPANPAIWLNPEKKNFYDFTMDDIKIEGYPREEIDKKNPPLKFEVAI